VVSGFYRVAALEICGFSFLFFHEEWKNKKTRAPDNWRTGFRFR
jgi:hypothetical protein